MDYLINKKTSPVHENLKIALVAVLAEYGSKMTAQELLAVTANLVGNLIACQDQRTMTPLVAMEIVTRNIEQGNKNQIGVLMQTMGNA